MPEPLRWRLVALMCLRCDESLLKLTEEELAFALRLTMDELAQTKKVFLQKRFIDDEWQLLNWGKRQFASDDSKGRVQRHRDKMKGQPELFDVQNDVKRYSNGLDTEADTETKQKDSCGAAAEGIALPVLDGAPYIPTQAEFARYQILYPTVDVTQQFRSMCGWLEANGPKKRAGVRRFIAGWLKRELNEARTPDARPDPTVGMKKQDDSEARRTKERAEQLAVYRYSRDNGTPLWKSAEPWIIKALEQEDVNK